MEQIQDIMNIVLAYFSRLDWTYILTFILIAAFLKRDGAISWLPEWIRNPMMKVPVTWRVLLLGIVYGGLLYWLRGYHGRAPVENMISSLVFAMVFHGTIIQYISGYIDKKFNAWLEPDAE